MIRAACIIAAKDLRLLAFRGTALVQALLLGLVLIILFSLSLDGHGAADATVAAAMFWLASAFCLVLVFNALFSLEETHQARLGLLLAPAPLQAVWLGKAVAGFVLLLVVQAALAVASVVFLGQSWMAHPALALAAVVLVDAGVAALGVLLGALAQGQATRESLCSIILFPLLVPLFLAGIRVLGVLFRAGLSGAAPVDAMPELVRWLGLAAAFDAVFVAAALVLFPFIYGGDR